MEIWDEAQQFDGFLVSEEQYEAWRGGQSLKATVRSFHKMKIDEETPIPMPMPMMDLGAHRDRDVAFTIFAIKSDEIWRRYTNQGFPNDRNWTPKQQRRLRKQTDKWRKRIMGV